MTIQPVGAQPLKDNENKQPFSKAVNAIDEMKLSPQDQVTVSATSAEVASKTAPLPDLPLRLAIERDADSGEWIYKSVNRLTGEVVQQYPREEILRMKRSVKYSPGTIIKTKI